MSLGMDGMLECGGEAASEAVTITGNDSTRLFVIDDNDSTNSVTTNFFMRNLTITGGNGTDMGMPGSEGPGGAIFNRERLDLDKVTIRDNHTLGGFAGGGI